MMRLPKQETMSLISLHGWSAVVLGLLLYAVVATGTIAVLSEEILHWSVGHVQPVNPLEANVDGIVRSLSNDVEPEFLEEIGLGPSPGGNLEVFFHMHRTNEKGELEDYGAQFEIEPATHEVMDKRTGSGSELHHTHKPAALSRFLVNIHTELHIPQPWGLLITGILGLAMLVAAISGFLMHRQLFTDMFVLRWERSRVTQRRDIHTVAGTWGLPFAFAVAFTGSFFSFAGAFGLPAMAAVAFAGDQEAMIRTVVGMPETESKGYETTANINRVIEDGNRRIGNYPDFATISHFGRDDAKILLFFPPRESKLEPVQLEYNGVSGELNRYKPSMGLVPSMGSAVFSLVGPLHFGNFAGILSKFVWLALGFASSYVILSGLSLWVARRREKQDWRWLERMTSVFGIGLPLAMLVSAAGYFLSTIFAVNPNVAVPLSFCCAATLAVLSGLMYKNSHGLKLALLSLCVVFCFSMPCLRILTGGPFWNTAIQQQNVSIVMIDVLLLACGLFSLAKMKKALLGGHLQHKEKIDEAQSSPVTR